MLKWSPCVELLRLDGRVIPGLNPGTSHDERYLWVDFFETWY